MTKLRIKNDLQYLHKHIDLCGFELEYDSRFNECWNSKVQDPKSKDKLDIAHVPPFPNVTSTRDVSVSCNNGYPLEIVSDPCDIRNSIQFLIELETFPRFFSMANHSCGFHVHFNGEKLNWLDLKKMLLGIFLFEPFIYALSPVIRVTNKYCMAIPIYYNIDDLINISSKTDIINLIYQNAHVSTGKLPTHFHKYGPWIVGDKEGYRTPLTNNDTLRFNSRYCGLNIFSYFYRGTIEFRYLENLTTNIPNFKILLSILEYIFRSTEAELVDNVKQMMDLFESHTFIRNYLGLLGINRETTPYENSVFSSYSNMMSFIHGYDEKLKIFHGKLKSDHIAHCNNNNVKISWGKMPNTWKRRLPLMPHSYDLYKYEPRWLSPTCVDGMIETLSKKCKKDIEAISNGLASDMLFVPLEVAEKNNQKIENEIRLAREVPRPIEAGRIDFHWDPGEIRYYRFGDNANYPNVQAQQAIEREVEP